MKDLKLVLTPRDLRVLSHLEKWGILGLGQLYGTVVETGAGAQARVARFFNETSRRDYGRWFTQRLTALCGLGYLKEHYYVNHPKMFTLAERGHAELEGRSLSILKRFRDSLSEELLSHELTVAAVGLVLTELHGLRVRTERERYVWTGPRGGGRSPAPVRAVSDLWVVDSRPKAIEVEMGQKSESRYKEIWDAYRLRLRENAVVLYLTAWPDGVNCIRRLARKFHAPFIHVCALSEFRNTCGSAAFEGAQDGQMVSLGGAVPEAGAVPRRVSPPSLPARQDVSAGGRLGVEPFAAPSRSAIGTLTPPLARRGQSVPPPANRACPRPLPLSSPSPSPEGDNGGTPR